MKLILVRHGETDLNRDGRILGLTDAPLNATGRAQARAVAAPLTAELPFKMYTSPLARALETAQIVADAPRHRLLRAACLRLARPTRAAHANTRTGSWQPVVDVRPCSEGALNRSCGPPEQGAANEHIGNM